MNSNYYGGPFADGAAVDNTCEDINCNTEMPLSRFGETICHTVTCTEIDGRRAAS